MVSFTESVEVHLRNVAQKVLDDAVWNRREFTGHDIADEYELSDSQLQWVKQDVKTLAGNLGLLWGYDDLVGRYRICPPDDNLAAVRILRYAYTHWNKQGRNLESLVKGARLQGLITQPLAAELRAVSVSSTRSTNRAMEKLLRVKTLRLSKDLLIDDEVTSTSHHLR